MYKDIQKSAKRASLIIIVCLKNCLRSGLELLSVSTVFAVCHDSSVLLVQWPPLSMIGGVIKSQLRGQKSMHV